LCENTHHSIPPLRPDIDGQDQVQIIVARALNCIVANLLTALTSSLECPFFEKFIEFIKKYFYQIFRKKGLQFFDKFDKKIIFIKTRNFLANNMLIALRIKFEERRKDVLTGLLQYLHDPDILHQREVDSVFKMPTKKQIETLAKKTHF
jgi:hypothetical protein